MRGICLLFTVVFTAAFGKLTPDIIPIAYSPADSKNFIGSPSILVLENGNYLVSHDFFGEGDSANSTVVYFSPDKGATWRKQSTLDQQFWSGLFMHGEAAYLLGTRGEFGPVVIRRSTDQGATWTNPVDADHGLLTADRPYHGAAVPVIDYDDRLWRGFEFKGDRVLVLLSIATDDNLLEAANWRQAELSHPNSPSTWLEGNLVVTPDGELVSILRREFRDDTAALVRLKDAGSRFEHQADIDIIDFPGGGSKFTIRYDEKSQRYWSLVNKQTEPEGFRNHLVLISSSDLYSWQIERQIAYHPDAQRYSWQYADWQIDGDDMVAALRIAADYSDEQPKSAYHTNILGFLRIEDFRDEPGSSQKGEEDS
ncbi:MAG: sialidase family protein [Pseudomonadota bacterium]